MITTLYHATMIDEWQRAGAELRPASLEEVGYVHCSFDYQVPDVLRRYFGAEADVVVLEIDVPRLGSPVQLEPGAGGETDFDGTSELFPHVMGPIERTAVRATHERERFAPIERTLDGDLAGYRVTDDRLPFDAEAAVAYLQNDSYWAAGRDHQAILTSFTNSRVVGAYAPDGSFAGMARVVTDVSTMWYLADLFVLPPHRGHGLASAIVETLVGDRRLGPLSGFLLTADAHGLYEPFGFERSEETQRRFMRRPRRSAAPDTGRSAIQNTPPGTDGSHADESGR